MKAKDETEKNNILRDIGTKKFINYRGIGVLYCLLKVFLMS